MKILCICPIGIGNYLLFYPACKIIKEKQPDISLHLLALRYPIVDLAAGDPLWDGIHVIDPVKEKSPLRILEFILKIRSLHFNCSLSFFPSNKWQYNLLPFVSGIKKRMAFKYALKRVASGSFLNNCMVPVDSCLHDVYQNIRLSETFLGRDLQSESVKFPPMYTQKDLESASTIIKEVMGQKIHAKKIAIHPGSSCENGMDVKRWEPERFGLLAERICIKINAHALIFGGPDEKKLKERVASVMSVPCTIIEPVKLSVTAALISQSVLCLCNDSGLMHIAACCGVKVAAVFGPTDEKRNGPFGKGHLIIRKNMPHFPLWTAGNVGVRHIPEGIDPKESLKELSVDDAWAMVQPWLENIV